MLESASPVGSAGNGSHGFGMGDLLDLYGGLTMRGTMPEYDS